MGVASLILRVVVCIILIMFPFTTVHAVPDFQVDALNAFKNALVDPQFMTSSWDTTHDNPCKWFHTTCNDDNLLTRIDLGGAQLSGHLVPDLGNLTSLMFLSLYNNNLTGQIPPELGNLKNLRNLLYQNQLSGLVPVELSKFPPGAIDIANNPGLCGNLADPPRKC